MVLGRVVLFWAVVGGEIGVCVDWGLGGCVVMERRWLSGILDGGFLLQGIMDKRLRDM